MGPYRRHLKLVAMGAMLVLCAHRSYAEDLLMGVRLNGQIVSDGELVSIDGDKIMLSPSLVHQLRLHVPMAVAAKSATAIELDQLPGVHVKIDRQALMLDIDADPDRFDPTVVQNYVAGRTADAPTHDGAFMNYNLLAQDTGAMDLTSGLFSLGAFGDYGVAMSDFAVTSEQGATRLRNYITHDLPDESGRLIFGDSFLPGGAIGEEFPFGGIQVTSRASATDLHQIPVETVLGQATVPSTVDVFVNDALQSRQSVPTGPFVLENIPVATGDGNIRVVVRDALGQEQVIVRSFYASPYILPEGSGEYSYESGFLRRSYGTGSFDYAEPFTSGTQRYGWTRWLTTEFHGEASLLRQVIGEQTSFLVAPYGTIRTGGAASDHNGVPGMLGLLGAETSTHPFSIGVSGEMATHHFTQLGYVDDRTLQQSAQVQANYDLGKSGALSASLIHLDLIGQTVSNTGAFSYSIDVPRVGFFGASAFATLGNGATGVILSFSVPLGDNAIASAQISHDQNGWSQSAQAVQNAPTSGGWGYRALADHSAATQRAEAGATYRSDYNEVTADGGTLNGLPVGRLGATGSVGLFGGELFAAHQTDGNFAVVDTDGVPNVHVYADQQFIGTTDDDGKLVIPRLRPHEINRIELDPADIPFDVTVPKPEMEVVPRNQTGYIVDFGLQRSRAATATLIREDGSFVPLGFTLRNAKTGAGTVVGHDGVVYLTGLTGDDRFETQIGDAACKIDIVLPDAQTVQPDLGAIKCHS